MEEIHIKLTSFRDVQEMVRLAAARDYDIILSDGSRECSAQSFMCVFSLNFKRPLVLKLDCSPEEAEDFRRSAAKILAL